MAVALPSIHGNPVACRALSRLSFGSPPPFSSRRTFSCSMSSSNKTDYWTSINADIDVHLEQAIPIKPPLVVYEPMRHLTFAAPETSAPALCIAACELVGGSRDQAMAAASALRLMHAAAYTHENLPVTDRPWSSSSPVFNHKFGPNMELLTGDGMIPFGFELLAKLDDPTQNNSDRVLRVIIEISRGMGSQGLIEGQYNNVQHDQSNRDESPHATWLQRVCKKKEGTLHACAGACGAILGGGGEEEIEKLRRFGLYGGMIQRIYNYMGEGNEEWSLKEVKELRNLALEELKDFSQEKVKAISSLVDTKL